MTKFMVLLCMMIAANACAQQQQPTGTALQGTLYPYRDQSGRFGYADENRHIRIEPQYKRASFFTPQGFAVITDSADKKGVIDQNNKIIIAPEYDDIRLHVLDDFTLAETHQSYYSRGRFWEWQFLPGFNLMGSSNDNRIFDTKVKRLKKTVFILGDKLRKVAHERLTDKGYPDRDFNIRLLDDNQVLIDDALYAIRAGGARLIASGIIGPLTEQTFARRKDQRLYIIDSQGKQVDGKPYRQRDSITFKIEDLPLGKRLNRDDAPIASAYENNEGQVFIYPDFSKPLPWRIHDNIPEDDLTAEELIRGLWMLAPVPDSDYFVLTSFRNGERFFRFLDTQGNWHQALPPGIRFTVVQRSGNILWPPKEHYLPENKVPEGWKIDRITSLGDHSLFQITLLHDKTVRQGIWDFEKKQWLIAPENYQVYPMDDLRQWRYEPEHGGLWGIMDHNGTVLIKPTYTFLHPDGWVTRQVHGKSISYYLHLPTLTEFREK